MRAPSLPPELGEELDVVELTSSPVEVSSIVVGSSSAETDAYLLSFADAAADSQNGPPKSGSNSGSPAISAI